VQPIKVAHVDNGQALIEQGLTAGEQVVVDGQYKLQPGSKVKLPEPKESGGQQAPRSSPRSKASPPS
jgi:multidrug efflux system membrane fusion protein